MATAVSGHDGAIPEAVEAAVVQVRRTAAELGRTPQAQELPSTVRDRVTRHFGSYAAALDALGLPRPLRYDAWTRERVVRRMQELWAAGQWITTVALPTERVLLNRTYRLFSSFDHARALAAIPPLVGRVKVGPKRIVQARRRFVRGEASLDELASELQQPASLVAMLLRGFAGEREDELARVPSELTDEDIAVLRRRALECGDEATAELLGKPFGLPAHHVRRVVQGSVREAAGTAARRRPARSKRRTEDLSDVEVRRLRERYAEGRVQQAQLALEVGLSRGQMSALLSGQTRLEAGGPILSAEQRQAQRWAVEAASGPRRPNETEQALAAQRLETMREAARALGGACLAEGYIRSTDAVTWRCLRGHTWAAPARSVVKEGRWCPSCAGRLTPEERLERAHEVARERGGRCLAERPIAATENVGWECADGHRWQATPHRVLGRGTWCPRCAGKRETHTQLRRLRAIAEERGGSLLSDVYRGHRSPHEWVCGEGHRWTATPHSVVDNEMWCPTCAEDERQAAKLAALRELGLAHGGRLLSAAFGGPSTKLDWECAEGHRWTATPRAVQRGSWCPVCTGRGPRPAAEWLNELGQLAATRGGRCNTATFTSASTKLEWECAEGHRWWATGYSVKHQGTWCPVCAGQRPREEALAELRRLAEERGGVCLSVEYGGSGAKHRFRCARGHEWDALPYAVRQGAWCAQCAGRRVDPTEILRELSAIAAERGGRLVSTAYAGSHGKLEWECAEGHRWWTLPRNVRVLGTWCAVCAGTAPLTIDAMREVARERGGECLSARMPPSGQKLRWRCAAGHLFRTPASNIKRGSWCPRCARTSQYTLEDMQRVARERGGQCLSKTFRTLSHRLRWKCAEGHTWLATGSSVLSRGSWCAFCTGRAKLTLRQMREIAHERGGRCLSSAYVDSSTKLRWRCAVGHEWEAAPRTIRAGAWCHFCHPTGAGVPEVKAFLLGRVHALARERGGECLSTEYVSAQTKLDFRCQFGHRWQATPNQIGLGSFCPICVHARRITIEEMRRIARSKGGQCLSDEIGNARTKLQFECAKGHRWWTSAGTVKHHGCWCPECAKEVLWHGPAMTLADARRLAAQYGGECLSTEYTASSLPLTWRCRYGHVFDKAPRVVKRGGWCPECTGLVPLTIEDMHAAAKARDGLCLSTEYVPRRKLEWECAKGHQFRATGHSVRDAGTWCPQCNEPRPNVGLARAHALARERDGACLSSRHVSADKPLRWRCRRGHEWRATEAVIASGRWCPKCPEA